MSNGSGWMTRFVALLLALALIAPSSPLTAQPLSQCTLADFERCLPDGVTSDELADLLGQARAAIDAGDWALALENLDRAAQILPLGVTLVARANALWQLGRIDEALALCGLVASDVDPLAVERAAALRALIESTQHARESNPAAAPAEAADPTEVAEVADVAEVAAPSEPGETPAQPPWQPSNDLAEPVPSGRGARNVLLATSSSLAVGFGAAAVALGARSNRLEEDARTYDRAAPDASILELNGIERDASRASSQANACFSVAAFAGGALLGLVLERWLGR